MVFLQKFPVSAYARSSKNLKDLKVTSGANAIAAGSRQLHQGARSLGPGPWPQWAHAHEALCHDVCALYHGVCPGGRVWGPVTGARLVVWTFEVWTLIN